MNRFSLCITLSFCSTFVIAQINYLDFKEKYSLSCQIPDSSIIVKNQALLDSIAALDITDGQKEFLYDYGWTYYMRYLKWKEKADLEKAAVTFHKGWDEHLDLNALWNVSGIYRHLGDCEKSIYLTELYVKEAPDSIVETKYKDLYYRYKFCRE